MEPSAARRHYVAKLLELYRRVPGTTGQLRRCDRQLAAELHDRGVSLQMLHAAIILAVTRRTFRPHDSPPLAPIATLHYFRPVLDELINHPPEPGYLDYLRYKLSAVAPELVAGLDPQ